MSPNFRTGDIVWANPTIPSPSTTTSWSPALITSSSDLTISLSFFNNPIPTRTFFLESELLPFDQPFPFTTSIPPQNDAFRTALRLFGLRIVSGLTCRCIITGHNEDKRGLNRFEPDRVLAFVLHAAVSPWVEGSRVVDAVKLVANVHAFRRYSSVRQKKLYQENRKLGDNVKLHRCSSLSQKVHLGTRKSAALESKDKSQVISKQGEENSTIGAIRRLNPTVPDLEGYSGKAELFMHSTALIPLHIRGNNLKLERQNLLRFKSILPRGLVDMCFGNYSRMREAHFSISSNLNTHLISYISKRKEDVPRLCSGLEEAEITICLNRKRKRGDKHDLGHVFPQTSRTHIKKNTRPRILNIKMLEPEESIQIDYQARVHFGETNINFTDKDQKLDMKRSQHLTLQQSFTREYSPNMVADFQSDNCEVDASAAKVNFVLGSKSPVYQKRLQRIRNGDITPLKSKDSVRIKSFSGDCLVESKDSYHYIASCSTFKSKVGQQSKPHVPLCSKSLHMKFPYNFNIPSKEQLIKNFSVFGSVDSSSTRVSWHYGSAQVVFFKESDTVAAYHYAKRKVWFGEPNIQFWLEPFEHERRELKCSYLISPLCSKSLHMKFPKNFNLPSKEQLIKKFSVFGSVDSSSTRVSWYCGSAQVAFFKESDAVVAYKYAKRKIWFGEPNIRFWLDPFEHKRRDLKCSYPMQPSSNKLIGPPLKSCLKKSNSLKQENRKKHYRVRFTVET
ncbi:uncharacterized protein LOC131593558 [Vicia villosa]|uniref:uncharacterized protein LOC131593558 n=1 Tax=Vicia villosa TaxID=3911 RepID=UPI00273BDC16|nr:uncharacterized protein LOC131593558 [Vicia villosa]